MLSVPNPCWNGQTLDSPLQPARPGPQSRWTFILAAPNASMKTRASTPHNETKFKATGTIGR